jgi:hypothetical protein
MLLRHAAAYGFYVFAFLLYFVTQVIWSVERTPESYLLVAQTNLFFNIVNFVQQVLLARVYWDLGSKADEEVKEVRSEDPEISQIIEEEFDEDAALQASMWNRMCRKTTGIQQSSKARSFHF